MSILSHYAYLIPAGILSYYKSYPGSLISLCTPYSTIVAELLNLPTFNKKSCNVYPTFYQPQQQYDNNLNLLRAR